MKLTNPELVQKKIHPMDEAMEQVAFPAGNLSRTAASTGLVEARA